MYIRREAGIAKVFYIRGDNAEKNRGPEVIEVAG
jgi:hypothetical protein